MGTNSYKTHPKFGRTFSDGTVIHHMHAEMDVLRFAKPGDTLDVMRFRHGDGTFAMSKPCVLCMALIIEKGIKKVRYTDSDGKWQSIKF